MSVDELLLAARQYVEQGRMRRFAAVLRHREAGISANAMGVWVVPADRQETFGKAAATFAAVSHCYLRPTYEDWPYSIFTMVHAPSQGQCEQVLAEISKATGIWTYAALYSTKEYKKVRVKYFVGDFELMGRLGDGPVSPGVSTTRVHREIVMNFQSVSIFFSPFFCDEFKFKLPSTKFMPKTSVSYRVGDGFGVKLRSPNACPYIPRFIWPITPFPQDFNASPFDLSSSRN